MTEGPGTSGDGRPRDHPERFGAYRVEEVIGAGGMGVVYRALDEALQRQVALKTLVPALAADPEFVARFKREAQSAAALNHPNITQIYAIGQEGTIPFFAMELIHGRSLETLVRDGGPLDPLQAAGYILQAAQGLQHAARRELIHRDVKPSNLMLTDDGIVKITDFGLAKAAKSETRLTATGEVLGSPGYISPEQAQGLALDARSDIYSLGATFYHLVTGRLPFEAPTPVAMIIKHMNEPLRSPRAVNPNIPYPIASIVQKMMAKRAGERFQDYDALIRELERGMSAVPAGTGAASGVGAMAVQATAGVAAGPVPRTQPLGRAAGTTARMASGVRPPVAESEAPEARAGSPLPAILAGLLGVMVVFGVLQHRRAAREEAAEGGPESRTQESRPVTTQIASPMEAEGTFTGRPADPSQRPGGPPGQTIEERLRERFRQRTRASLIFISNDHEILPDGRLKVMGRVQNTGGSAASQARVRIRVLLENGTIVSQGETPLVPSAIPAGGSASFELPLSYSGPVGTIKAELVWVE